jgi:hypothetical protein
MADTYINGIRVPFLPPRGVEGLKEKRSTDLASGQEFKSILEEQIKSLTFSRHAAERMQKGAKDSLVILRDLAFIVNVKNRMVVTAMDGDRLKENVFTNIDSAIIAG